MHTLFLQFLETLDKTLVKRRGGSDALPGIMNLTVSQLQYLDAIASMDNATVTAIAIRLRVTKPSATAAVNRLIAQGYVRKNPSAQDGRVHILELTAEGDTLAKLKEQAAREYQAYIQKVLSPAELSAFESALQKLVDQYHKH
ncbi:MAG: winged helix-turn-helix transcriptional regulator [Anaerolineaceae bacterium]|jgi:DNA-binding MarR family transcriptional regulator|nr:winged helix-turn-helix transcriptional regulator [Anaerolineaceae bacterium]